jgi:hypothetical protein
MNMFHCMAITMIGEMIGELTGKQIGIRLPRHHGGEITIERTIEAKGKILGQEVTFIATTWSKEKPQGGISSKGHGIMMTKSGGKAKLWGSGISVPTAGAGWSIRGARYLQTSDPALSRLNNVALLFEIEIGEDGSYHDKMWVWK